MGWRRQLLAFVGFVGLLTVVGTVLTGRPSSSGQPSSKTPSQGPATPDPSVASLSNLTPLIAVVYDVAERGSPGLVQLASDGAKRAAERFGAEYLAVPGQPDDTDADREARLLHLASTRSSLIFVVGSAYVGPVAKVAAMHPATWFGVIDATVDAPNVTGILFHDEQGSFLVGVAAALTSKRGSVGFIGAARVPAQQRFEAGFAAGARAVNPDVKIRVAYLATPPGDPGPSGPAEAKEIALAIYNRGADVIFAVAGDAAEGAIQAANERGLWAIGAETDSYLSSDPTLRNSVLTSMLKRADVATYTIAAEVANDIAKDGTYVFGIGEGGVGYSTSGGFVDAIKPQIDDFAARIAAGEILVPTTP